MKALQLPTLVLACLLAGGCISKEAVVPVQHFRPALAEVEARPVQGTRPLRLERVAQPVEIGAELLWRVSETELVPDETNLWARRPDELLDERLRDLLYGAGGFYASYSAGDPTLNVRIVRYEGDLFEKSVASVELVLTLTASDRRAHRGRVRVEEELEGRSAEALAEAMGRALTEAAARVQAWTEARL